MLYEKLEKLEDRKDLPLNGPDNYRVNNNIVYTLKLMLLDIVIYLVEVALILLQLHLVMNITLKI